jgi:hypothetical protein
MEGIMKRIKATRTYARMMNRKSGAHGTNKYNRKEHKMNDRWEEEYDMMHSKGIAVKREEGLLLMKGDKAWGIVYEDGRSTSYGWMNPADAPLHNPKFCTKPSDVTYDGDYNLPEIRKGRLVPVVRETVVRVIK